jgi:hypothetical protein
MPDMNRFGKSGPEEEINKGAVAFFINLMVAS